MCILMWICAGVGWANPAAPLKDLTAGPARQVEQVTVKVGHAELSFSGRCADLVSEGRTVGWMLDGSGWLVLRTTLAAEFPVVTRNLSELGADPAAKGEGELRIPVGVTRARILWAGLPFPAWAGTAVGGMGEVLAAHRASFAGVEGHDLSHLPALQAANGPDRPAVVIEVEGAGRKWIYTLDGVDRLEETLDFVKPAPSSATALAGISFLHRVSRQPVGWELWKGAPAPAFQVTRLDVDLRTADNRNAQFRVEEDITALQAGIRCLRFDLLTEIITDKDTRRLRVSKIQDGQGRALAFDHAKDELLVWLPEPLAPGTKATLTFDYAGDILIHAGGDRYWELGVRGKWYPSTWSYAGEHHAFHGTARTKGDWITFLPGDTVRRGKEGDWNIVETRIDRPVSSIRVFGGVFRIVSERDDDGVRIIIATIDGREAVNSIVLDIQAGSVLRAFKTLFGPVPFKEWHLVQVSDDASQEPSPSLIPIPSSLLKPGTSIQRVKAWEVATREHLVRSIAHQYWGVVVKAPTKEDRWVTDAFAEYLAGLFVRTERGEAAWVLRVDDWRTLTESNASLAPIPLANDLVSGAGPGGHESFTGLTFNKGPWLLYTLHEEHGDKAFSLYLRAIQANFAWKFLSTYRLTDLLNYITKKDNRPFMERYFWGLEVPSVPKK